MSNKILELTKSVFQTEVLENELPVLVDFWAEWCGPCRMMAPVFDELAADFASSAAFAKVNVDSEPELASKYGVMSIPTLVFFKDGKEVTRLVGLQSKENISKLFK